MLAVDRNTSNYGGERVKETGSHEHIKNMKHEYKTKYEPC